MRLLSRQGSALLLLGLLVAGRWPTLLPPNFSHEYALAFCAGVYLPGRLAWCLPMGVLFGTDLILNARQGVPWLSRYMALNYVTDAALIGLGRQFYARRSWLH